MIKPNSIIRAADGSVYLVADTAANDSILYIEKLACGGGSIGKYISKVAADSVHLLGVIDYSASGGACYWQFSDATGVYSGGGYCKNKMSARVSLPQLARVIADGKLRKDLRQQRNKLARGGDAEAAAAIDTLLQDAKTARGGEDIPFTVMITPNLFRGLQKLKSWGKHESLPGMVEEILAEAIRTELRARLAKGYDVPQSLVEEFLLTAENAKSTKLGLCTSQTFHA